MKQSCLSLNICSELTLREGSTIKRVKSNHDGSFDSLNAKVHCSELLLALLVRWIDTYLA